MTVARAMYPITKDEYLERKDKPLPQIGASASPAPSPTKWYSPKKQSIQQTFSAPVWKPKIEALAKMLQAEAVSS